MIKICLAHAFAVAALFSLRSDRAVTASSTDDVSTSRLEEEEYYTPIGFQVSSMDPMLSTFASHVVYDAEHSTIFITGTAVGGESDHGTTASCFLVSLALIPDVTRQFNFHDPGYNAGGARQSCSQLYLQGGKALLVGSAESTGVLGSLLTSDANSKQHGMVLDMQVDTDYTNLIGGPQMRVVGGGVLQNSAFVTPAVMDVVNEEVYIASLTSSDTDRDLEYDARQDPQRFNPAGVNSSFRISRLHRNNAQYQHGVLPKSLDEDWAQEYYASGDDVQTLMTGIAKLGSDTIIVTGATTGYGAAVGSYEPKGDDFDGFITKVDASSGLVSVSSDPNHIASKRLASLDNKNDFIAGICHHDASSDYFYVVGSTDGILDGTSSDGNSRGFVMKVEAITLLPLWTEQVAAIPRENHHAHVRGVSCTVTPDGEELYFAGVVENGAVLPDAGAASSFGGNDVFIAKITTDDGQLEYIRQVGSSGQESLAMRGSVTTDSHGNAIVVGSTDGSMFRERDAGEAELGRTEVFVMSFARDTGKSSLVTESPPLPSTSYADFPPQSPPAPPVPDIPATPIVSTSVASDSDLEKDSDRSTMHVSVAVGALASIAFFVGYSISKRAKKVSVHFAEDDLACCESDEDVGLGPRHII